MATEYKLSYTGAEINEKLGKVSQLETAIADKADLIEVTDTTTGEKKKAVLSVEDGILVVREA